MESRVLRCHFLVHFGLCFGQFKLPRLAAFLLFLSCLKWSFHFFDNFEQVDHKLGRKVGAIVVKILFELFGIGDALGKVNNELCQGFVTHSKMVVQFIAYFGHQRQVLQLRQRCFLFVGHVEPGSTTKGNDCKKRNCFFFSFLFVCVALFFFPDVPVEC